MVYIAFQRGLNFIFNILSFFKKPAMPWTPRQCGGTLKSRKTIFQGKLYPVKSFFCLVGDNVREHPKNTFKPKERVFFTRGGRFQTKLSLHWVKLASLHWIKLASLHWVKLASSIFLMVQG
jgi:hypothetical protein